MQYKLLGSSGGRVSSLCLGTMSLGGDADEETSAAMFHRCQCSIRRPSGHRRLKSLLQTY